jgi:CPA2 family monovalent cation:H+ antiporter-2
VARVCAPEVFLLAVLAVCFATAYLTSLAGVSVSLGAFLAGLVVSESRFSSHALGEILPLQVVFTATFFVSVGMLLDPAFLVEEPVLVAAVVGGVLVIKLSTGTLAARLVGVALPIAVASAFTRAQIGEFSFVLEQVGREAGLSPIDLGEDGIQAFLAASVILMVLTPALSPFGARFGNRLREPSEPGKQAFDLSSDGDELADHVIVAGYGEAARRLVPDLRSADIPFVVTTLNPQGALYGRGLGVPILLGDASKSHALERARIRAARLLVVADDDEEMAKRIAGVASALNPDVEIVLRLDEEADVDELADSGADVIVTGPSASARELAGVVVRHYYGGAELDRDIDADPVDLERVIRFEPKPSECTHYGRVQPVLPSAPGCEECLQMGDTWVHLRICLTCGHVGCCDDSPNRHARRHASELHPIARSLEADQEWAWCYPDEVELEPTDG